MTIQTKPSFPTVTRLIVELFETGALPNVAEVEVEPEYGYVTRMRYVSGAIRMTRGGNIGVNLSAACEVVKDKGYAKDFLRRSGIDCPAGEVFLLPWWAAQIKSVPEVALTIEQLLARVREEYLFPVYVKPVDGSQGQNVWRCRSDDDLLRALEVFEQERIRVALVERAVDLPDFRLTVLDGVLISAYRRIPLSVVGDGRSSIQSLLQSKRDDFAATGRKVSLREMDGRITSRLTAFGLGWTHVPMDGEVVPLLDLSNLSAGGTPIDLTAAVHSRWAELASRVAREFGLRLCGVDLACADLTDHRGIYSVLEVNASPGFEHYGSLGGEQVGIVRDMYCKVLNSEP